MADLDFGPINVPDECCEDTTTEDTDSPVLLNYQIIAYLNGQNVCQDYRKFTVNLHTDGSWSYTYLNGESLSQEEINAYCDEINGVKAKLENDQRWKESGSGLNLWNPEQADSEDSTLYSPAASGGSTPYNANGTCVTSTCRSDCGESLNNKLIIDHINDKDNPHETSLWKIQELGDKVLSRTDAGVLRFVKLFSDSSRELLLRTKTLNRDGNGRLSSVVELEHATGITIVTTLSRNPDGSLAAVSKERS
jgi:hypothetical protein